MYHEFLVRELVRFESRWKFGTRWRVDASSGSNVSYCPRHGGVTTALRGCLEPVFTWQEPKRLGIGVIGEEVLRGVYEYFLFESAGVAEVEDRTAELVSGLALYVRSHAPHGTSSQGVEILWRFETTVTTIEPARLI